MEKDLHTVRETLDEVESSLKELVRDTKTGIDSYRLDNCPHMLTALSKVQEAIAELLQIR